MYYKKYSNKTRTYLFSTFIGMIGLSLALQFGTAQAATFELLKSSSSNRSNPLPLANATVADENIYVYVSPATGISQVSFYLDTPTSGTPRQVEKNAPWDFASGGASTANPFNTASLTAGSHTITAKLTLSAGGTQEISAPFTKSGGTTSAGGTSAGGTSAYGLNLSHAADRSNPIPLGNATVADNIYVFVSPATGISQVSFYLNNSTMSGSPWQVENNAPWDFSGGPTTANPFNTNSLADGSNTITAKITLSGGGTQVINTPFIVKNGGTEGPITTVPPASSSQWGTYLKPFAANSLWNSRPVAPVFGGFVIPTSSYFPSIAEGAYSTGIFLSTATDGAITVKGIPGKKGLWNPDDEVYHDVTIPRWPSTVTPATGGDGHADIVDQTSGIIHSFWQLKFINGQWVAAQYAWTRIDGRGWADPAHYFQGARAAAVSTTAGLIRKHEIADGDVLYRHALAMSLTFNGLSPKPAYIFPATSADSYAENQNTGKVPEGALMLLPGSFNTQQIGNLALRKICETLKVYGAYVVDQNVGTPFAIYVENGSGFNLHKGGWDNDVAAELDLIRKSLRQVVAVNGWLDGNSQAYSPNKNLNILSMRGPWQLQGGATIPGVFNSWAQAVVFPSTSTPTVQINWNASVNRVYWAIPTVGTTYQLTAKAQGGAKLRLKIRDSSYKTVYDSGELGNGETSTFAWPVQGGSTVVYAISGLGGPSSIGGNLVKID